jgi:predicted site-specific integrase-resolvase
MRKQEALEVLGCSYNTLRKLAKQGRIRFGYYLNGHRNYLDEDVYGVVGRKINRNHWIVVYARVNSKGREGDERVEKQKQRVLDWALARGVRIDQVYEDRAPGVYMDSVYRPAFFQMMQSAFKGEIDCIVTETRCRLARVGFDLVKEMLRLHGVRVIVLNEIIEDSYYREEQTEDLARLIEQAREDRVGGQSPKQGQRNRSEKLKGDQIRLPMPSTRHPGLPGTEGLPV